MYTTIRQKIRILIYSFFSEQPFDQKWGSSLIYFFRLQTTIWQNVWSPYIYSFFVQGHLTKKLGLHLCNFLFVDDHLTKVRDHSYSLIYYFLNCANIWFATVKAVLPLSFVQFCSLCFWPYCLFISSATLMEVLALIFRTLYPWPYEVKNLTSHF